jgi:hypothetical protein
LFGATTHDIEKVECEHSSDWNFTIMRMVFFKQRRDEGWKSFLQGRSIV